VTWQIWLFAEWLGRALRSVCWRQEASPLNRIGDTSSWATVNTGRNADEM
jgi:hypothetical protein